MRETAKIAQAFLDAASGAIGLAKAEFVTSFTLDDLRRLDRTPLLLVSRHMMYLGYSRHRQRGTQLIMDTYLITHNRRGERNRDSALEVMGLLDAIDALVVDKDLGLAIQPFGIHRREPVDIDKSVDKSLSVVRTLYNTLVYAELEGSKVTYRDANNLLQTVEFSMVPTSFQLEDELDTNDYDRVLDGSMKVYGRVRKKRFDLKFTLVSAALKDQLRLMKEAGTEITYYRDKDGDATMTCFWTNNFNFFEEQPGFWTGSMVLEEI